MNAHTLFSWTDAADTRRCGRWAVAYALSALLACAGLAGCSEPDDSTRGADSVRNAPTDCAPGRAFAPLLAPRAVLDSGIAGGCVACLVNNADAVVDAGEGVKHSDSVKVSLPRAGWAYVVSLMSAHESKATPEIREALAAMRAVVQKKKGWFS